MTFDPNIPRNLDSPGVFPPQCRTNWNRIEANVVKDHVFNYTLQDTDGYHKKLTLINVDTQPSGSLPNGSNGIFYSFPDNNSRNQLYYYNGNDTFKITPPFLVSVNFDGTGAISSTQTVRASYNVTDVFKNGTGDYTINFILPLVNNSYVVHVTGRGSGTNGITNGCVKGDGGSYNDIVKVNSIRVLFNGSGSDLRDVNMGCVTVIGF